MGPEELFLMHCLWQKSCLETTAWILRQFFKHSSFQQTKTQCCFRLRLLRGELAM